MRDWLMPVSILVAASLGFAIGRRTMHATDNAMNEEVRRHNAQLEQLCKDAPRAAPAAPPIDTGRLLDEIRSIVHDELRPIAGGGMLGQAPPPPAPPRPALLAEPPSGTALHERRTLSPDALTVKPSAGSGYGAPSSGMAPPTGPGSGPIPPARNPEPAAYEQAKGMIDRAIAEHRWGEAEVAELKPLLGRLSEEQSRELFNRVGVAIQHHELPAPAGAK